MSTAYSSFTSESVQRMLAFLPRFEHGDFLDVEAQYLSGQYPPPVDQLTSEIYDSGFIFPFDWVDWHWRDKLAAVEDADILTLRKLMTSFVRGDRFCGGALAGLCSNGSVERVLRRLKVLAATGIEGL